jgi:hypothetical protein
MITLCNTSSLALVVHVGTNLFQGSGVELHQIIIGRDGDFFGRTNTRPSEPPTCHDERRSRDHSKMQRKDKDEQNLIGDVHPRLLNQADSLNAEALQLCQPVGRGAEIKPRPEYAKERYNTKDAYEQRGREVHERHRLSADSLR